MGKKDEDLQKYIVINNNHVIKNGTGCCTCSTLFWIAVAIAIVILIIYII